MKRKKLFLIASITTIILYFMGVLTGYFVQVGVLTKTEEELGKVREEFYGYKQNLENIQLEQLYLTTHQGELSYHQCNLEFLQGQVKNDIRNAYASMRDVLYIGLRG